MHINQDEYFDVDVFISDLLEDDSTIDELSDSDLSILHSTMDDEDIKELRSFSREKCNYV
jgi:hypothetical protein